MLFPAGRHRHRIHVTQTLSLISSLAFWRSGVIWCDINVNVLREFVELFYVTILLRLKIAQNILIDSLRDWMRDAIVLHPFTLPHSSLPLVSCCVCLAAPRLLNSLWVQAYPDWDRFFPLKPSLRRAVQRLLTHIKRTPHSENEEMRDQHK